MYILNVIINSLWEAHRWKQKATMIQYGDSKHNINPTIVSVAQNTIFKMFNSH